MSNISHHSLATMATCIKFLGLQTSSISTFCLNRICINQKTLFHKYSGLPERGLLQNYISKQQHIINQTSRRQFRQKRPTTRRQTSGLSPVDSVEGLEKGFHDLFKPFLFTVGVTTTSFAAAALWQYEFVRNKIRKTKEAGHNGNNYRSQFYGKAGETRTQLNEWWSSLNGGEKTVGAIIAMNTLVFMLWKIPPLQHTMLKYFAASPSSGAPCLSLLLSTFSHYSAIHLFCNMYVLWSFTPSIVQLLGKEQFMAMYLSAGVISGFSSYLVKVARGSLVPSLGASGAIMAVLGAVCVSHPEAQLSIAFVGDIIPHSFSADSAMKGLILIDSFGILMGWRMLDHAAHLGGMLFGIWYASYGHKTVWGNREGLIKWWHQQRGNP